MGPIWVTDVSKWAGNVGPTWAAQITPTVYVWCPFSHVGPSRHLHRGSHPEPIWAMWFKWASGIWDPCGQPHIYPIWASGIWGACGLPRSPPLFMYDALLTQVGPSRYLHRGTHLGPMLVKVVLYLN